uniref:Uncharacterized protein n=1 Tax=Macrostomum lignano TaxID=282301 RepID=A0A1I8FM27_9PLAT
MLPSSGLEWLRQRAGGRPVHRSLGRHRSHIRDGQPTAQQRRSNVNAPRHWDARPCTWHAAKNNGRHHLNCLLLESPGADVDPLRTRTRAEPLAVAAEIRGHKGCAEAACSCSAGQQGPKSREAAVFSAESVQQASRAEEFHLRTALHAPRRNWQARRSSATPEELLTQRTASGRAHFLRSSGSRRSATSGARVIEDERQAREQEGGQAKEVAHWPRDWALVHLVADAALAATPCRQSLRHDGQQADPQHPGQQQQRRSAFRQRRLDPRLNAYEQWLKDQAGAAGLAARSGAAAALPGDDPGVLPEKVLTR